MKKFYLLLLLSILFTTTLSAQTISYTDCYMNNFPSGKTVYFVPTGAVDGSGHSIYATSGPDGEGTQYVMQYCTTISIGGGNYAQGWGIYPSAGANCNGNSTIMYNPSNTLTPPPVGVGVWTRQPGTTNPCTDNQIVLTVPPILTTTTVTVFTSTTATMSGTITSVGNTNPAYPSSPSATILDRGVVYATTANPTLASPLKSSNGAGNASISSSVSGLIPSTTYHVRTYATTSLGTGYGPDITFTTLAAPPVLANTSTLNYTENAATTAINTVIAITDADNSNITSATVSITGNFVSAEDVLSFTTQNGISGTYNSSNGVLSLSGTTTNTNYQTALRTIAYSNSSDNPSVLPRTVSFVVSDGQSSNTITSTINITAVNDAPVLASGSTLIYTENGTAAAINTAITIADVDNNNIASASISITNNLATAEDVLSFTNTANISGSYNSSTGVLTLSGADTKANYQTALRAVKYSNSSESPSVLARTVSFSVSDGALSSNIVTSTINVTTVNDAPILASGSTISYTENNPATAINTSITVTDLDNANITSASVSITGNFATGQDLLSFTNTANITGSYNSATGVLTLSGTDTKANYQTALRTIAYSNSSRNPSINARTVSFVVNDGAVNSNIITSTINITAVNDATVLANFNALTYTENGAAIAINNFITVSDLDNTPIASGIVVITNNLAAGEDVLSFTNVVATMGNIAGVYNAGTGAMNLTSAGNTATLAQWQAALQAVLYSNSSDNPSTLTRLVSYRITDNTPLNSNVVNNTIDITAVNDAPVLATGSTLAYTENDAATAINTAITVTDVDNANLSIAQVYIASNFVSGQDRLSFASTGNISGSFDSSTGTLTLSGTDTKANYQAALRTVKYSNLSDNPSTLARTVNYTILDGASISNVVTSTINVTAVNDAPALVNGSTLAYTENGAAAAINTSIVVSDLDNTTLASGTVSISNNFAVGEDVLSFTNVSMGNIVGTYNPTTGVMGLSSSGNSATIAQWQAALQAVQYSNSSENPSTAVRIVSYRVTDPVFAANSNTVTSTINVTAVNDAPALVNGSTLAYTENDAATAINTAITVTDVDNANLSIAQVYIASNFVSGQDRLSFTSTGNISGSFDNSTGTLTLSGTDTKANYQAALRAVKYSNLSDNPSTLARTVNYTILDGALVSNVVTSTINVTTVNDAPILANGSTLTYAENDIATSINTSIVVSDPDNTTLTSAVINISGNFAVGQDVLLFTNVSATMGNINGTYTPSTGVRTLSSSGSTATIAQWQAALQAVKYFNSSENPSTAVRTISYRVTDPIFSANSNTITSTINVVSVNDAPAVSAGGTLSYTEQATPTVIDNAITLTDVDNVNLTTATISIGNFVNGDILSFTNTANITGSYNSGTGVLTLTGTETLINYQVALRSVKFSNSSDNPTLNGTKTSRTISYMVNDGTNNSAIDTSTINVIPVNDIPVLTAGGTLMYTEGASATAINSSISVTDPDNVNLISASISLSPIVAGDNLAGVTSGTNISQVYDPATGTLTLSGTDLLAKYEQVLRSVKYNSTSQNPSNYGIYNTRVVNFVVNDGLAINTSATSAINITSINQAPNVVAGGTLAYTELNGATVINASMTVTDSDNLNLNSATVSISTFLAGDILDATVSGNIIKSYNAATGILTLTGSETIATYQQVLRSITYRSTSSNPRNYNTNNSRLVSYVIGDGTDLSTAVANTVNITAINDAPEIVAAGVLNYTEGGAASVINSILTVADNDNTTLISGSITLSPFFTGDNLAGVTSGTNISQVYDPATGTLTLFGTDVLANYQQVLRSIKYNSTSQNPSNYGIYNNRVVNFVVNDGSASNNSATSLISITSINQPPTVLNIIPNQATTEDSAFSFAFAANTFEDVDNILTYTARLASGAALPTWLTFDSATRTFSGTPLSPDVGTISIEVIAIGGPNTISINFDLLIQPNVREVTSGNYNAITGVLNVTGVNFVANATGADIDLTKFTITGEANATYTLTSPGVEITNGTTFSASLNSADKIGLNAILNKNGTASLNNITYNVAAAANWLTAAVGFADLTGNQILAASVTEIPVAIATPETGITPYTATLNGTIDPKFGNIIAGAFIVSKNFDLSNPITVPAFTPASTSITSAMPATAVTTTLTGLTSKTAYYYQLTATNSAGEGKGAIQGFMTLPSVNANLTNLAVNNGVVLSPIFATSTTTYSAAVGNAIANLAVTPTLEEATATIKINTATVANTVASVDLPLAVGLNTISTVITAEDGTSTKTYTITINRRAAQTITLAATATTTFGVADFDPGATSTNTGTPIVYSSSDLNVATIVGGKIHIIAAGTVTISADQAGDVNHDVAPTVTQTLTINKASQLITFAVLPNKTFNDPTFNLTATGGASNNTITYVSSNSGVATITGNVVTLVGAGTTTITAAQLGNANYLAASSVDQSLTVDKATATLTLSNLNYTYNGMPKSATVTTTPNGLSGVSITYNGSATAPTAAATYPVIATLTNANYTAVNATGNLVIDPLIISVTAEAKTKIYGTGDPALTYTFSPALISGDSFTGTLSRATGEHTGDYTIGQNNLALSSNYTLNYTPANFSIGKKTITVLAETKSKTYGDVDPALTYTFSPALISGDAFTGALNRVTGEHIGNYAIGQNTLALSTDYNLNYTTADLVIGKKTMVVLADSKAKTYGATDPVLTYTFSPALISGDNFTGTLNRVTGEHIGNYAIGQNTLALSSDYTLTYTTADLVIGKKAITVLADSKTKTYGDVDPTLTYTFSPALITGDSFTGALNRATGENIGNYAIGQNTLALSTDYILSYTTADLVINKLAIAVSSVAKTKIYGEADPALTYTFTPVLVSGDSFTGTLNRTPGEQIGSYAIAQNTLGLNANYTLNYTGADLVIGKKTITVLADAKTKTYGDVDPLLTYTFSPALVTGDSFTGALSRATGENIGGYAIGQNNLALNANYTLNYTTANLVIGKKTITVLADAKSKTYGDADPSLTYTFSPALISGDSFTGNISRAVGENIGSYAIGQNNLALSSNYTLNYTTADLVIGKKTITVLADAKSKTYGDADPSLTYTFSPALISGDSFTGNISRAVGENIGNYAIGQNSLVLSSNYTLNYTTADLVIGKKTITVLADAKGKTYGDADPNLTYTFTPALVSGDSFTGNISRAVGENIGSYAIGQNSLALSSNYSLVYTNADLTIGKKTITVLADAKTKTYGDVDPLLTYTFSPALVTGDSFTGTLSRAVGENIGSYAIGQNSLALSSNYSLVYNNADLTIGKKTITVLADAKSKTYGDADPSLTYTFSPALISGDSFTGTLSRAVGENIGGYAIGQNSLALNANYTLNYTTANLVIGKKSINVLADAKTKTYGDVDPSLTYTFSPALISGDSFTGNISRAVGENIGSYAIGQNSLALSSNYTLNYTNADLTIGKKTITVLADAKSKTYGDADPSLTYTFSPALISGDSFTGNISRAIGENIGSYAIGQNNLALSSNYSLVYTNADLTIGKKTITVLADAKSKTYGDADPSLTYTFSPALISGDSFSGALSRAIGENIGSYAIGQNSLALSSNYSLVYNNADLTIGKKTITVLADAKTKTYGDVDPALTYTFSPALISGDSFTGTLSRAVGENIGSYAIGQNSLTLNANYTLNYTTANLVIGKKTITVLADAKAKTYGDVDPSLTYTFSPALISGDSFTGNITRAIGENIGNYAIGQNSLALNSNYTLNYTNADLTIGKKIISVIADAKTKTYGDVDPILTYTFSPALITGDSFTGNISRAIGENIGNYAIGQNSLALNSNYSLVYTNADLTIGKKTITVLADSKIKTYGDVDPSLTYTFSPALITGDSFTGNISRAVGENIGNYAIGQGSLLLNSNYALNYTSADLTIGKKTIAITADPKSKIYGNIDPTLTYSFLPTLVSGDTFTGSLSRAVGENTGTYVIDQNSLALSANYTLTYNSASFTVVPRAIAVVADPKTKTYGSADPTLTYTFSPALATGDLFTGTLSRAVGENTGSYVINQNSLALNGNYLLNYTSSNLTIDKRTVTVIADSKAKTYGDFDPSLTYTFSPALATGDSFTGSLSRAIGENIGTYAIGKNTLTLNGNYTLLYTSADLTIGKKVISIIADAKAKTYGDVDPSLTYTFSPALITGDTFTGSLNRIVGENVGTYAIAQNSLTVNGNYSLNYAGANFTIGIKTIAVTADAKGKTYGDIDPVLTYTFSPVLKAGDGFTGNLVRNVGQSTGIYPINLGSLNLGSNYAINFTGADFTIGSKTINITADAKTKTYGDADPILTYTFSPALVTGDSFTGALGRLPGEHIGNYVITQSTLALNSNYVLNYTGKNLSIGTKSIVVTADGKTKIYGDADPVLTYKFSPSLATGDTFTGNLKRSLGETIGSYAIAQNNLALSSDYVVTYVAKNLDITPKAIAVTAVAKNKVYGTIDPALTYTFSPALVSGDNFTGNLDRITGENVGAYAIGRNTLALNGNYILSYNDAKFTIGSKPITITADAKHKTYGDADPVLTYSLSVPLAVGDSFTGNLTRSIGNTVGAYPINLGSLSAGNNYALNYAGADLTIDAKTITVTANALGKTYGDTDPTFSYVANPALVSGDNFTGTLSRTVGEQVGTYAIGKNTLALSNNYVLNFTGSNFVIASKTITVTADTKAKTYGDADPTLTYIFSPALVSGDAFTGVLSRAVGENVANYAINKNTLALNANYILNYTGANLVINKKQLTITADSKNKIFSAANPTLTASYSGFVGTETAAVLTVPATLSTTATLTSPPGNYPIDANGATAANYNISFVQGTLTVAANSQTITFGVLADKLSTDAIFGLTASSSAGLTIVYTSSDPTIARIVNGNQVEILKAGTVMITASQPGNANYAAATAVAQNLRVIDNAAPIIAISSSLGTGIKKGEETVLTASGALTYVWSTANGIIGAQNTATLTVRPSENTTYTVTGANQYGRTSTQTITITVTADLSVVSTTAATNIISPNGDGVNDYFVVKNIDLYPNNTITIFDRAGKTLYKVKSYKNDWDGSINGLTLEEGTYYYIIDFGDGKTTAKRGFITIVKE